MERAFENATTGSDSRKVTVRVPPNVTVQFLNPGISDGILVENIVILIDLGMPVNEGKGAAIIVTFVKISPPGGGKTTHLRSAASSPVFQGGAEGKLGHQNRFRRVANGAEFRHFRVRIAVADDGISDNAFIEF